MISSAKMNTLFPIILCFGLLGHCCLLTAQPVLHLHAAPEVLPVLKSVLADFKPAPRHPTSGQRFLAFSLTDSLNARRICSSLLTHLRRKSYLAASVDSFQADSLITTARLYLGPPMQWTHLWTDSIDQRWLDAAGFRSKLYADQPLRYEALLALQGKMLSIAENQGYPFAAVWLEEVVVLPDGKVSARLRASRGPFFTIGAVRIKGDLKLPPAFLPNYLDLRPGSPFSRQKILKANESLRSLLYVTSTANPVVSFSEDKATVNLYLNKKRAGRFDFIIGLLPRTNTDIGSTDATSRLLLTGNVDAAFLNALNLGENISLQMERLRPETQKLEAKAGVPYLFGTAFGGEGRIHIFRRDSTWLDAQGDIGVSYLFPGGNFTRFFGENRNLSLLKVDTGAIRSSRRLPRDLDMRQYGFGFETEFNRTDYRYNPRSGWEAHLKTVAGFSTVRRNAQIEAIRDEQFDFKSLYDTVSLRTTRFRSEIRAAAYIPLFGRNTLKCGFRGGGIFSNRPVYNNEQYRIGGHKLLRGFDEESIFATRFGVFSAEWRLLLGLNSYMAVFTDYGYVENLTDRNRLFLRPWGFGAGFNFETAAGIFGISLAVGRRDTGQTADLRAAKFHIGYVSLF